MPALVHLSQFDKPCRMLNDEDEYNKEENISTPTNKYPNSPPEQIDSVPRSSRVVHSSGKASRQATITPFGQRREKFAVKCSINQKLQQNNGKMEHDLDDSEDDFIRKVKSHKRCSMAVQITKPRSDCRFMYDRIEDRVWIISLCLKSYSSFYKV